ncbi:MAG: hypothetical protein ACM3US_03640 [Sphingomonadaceae bacterium]
MSNLPFGTADARLAESWFSAMAGSLEELLGGSGAQAILSRSLEDARARWPLLAEVELRGRRLDLSRLYANHPGTGGQGCSREATLALQGLVDSLRFLLELLLGAQMAAELMGGGAEDSAKADDREGGERNCA